MRGQPRSPVLLRIETLDQNDLLRSLLAKVIPLMLRVVLDGVCPALALRVGKDKLDGDEIVRGVEGAPVGDGEGFVMDGVADRTPDIDEAYAAGEEA